MAEIELSALRRQCLDRHILAISTVEREVAAWVERYNIADPGINGRFITADARIKLKRLYLYTSGVTISSSSREKHQDG